MENFYKSTKFLYFYFIIIQIQKPSLAYIICLCCWCTGRFSRELLWFGRTFLKLIYCDITKQQHPKLNDYSGSDVKKKLWSFCGSTYFSCLAWCVPTLRRSILEPMPQPSQTIWRKVRVWNTWNPRNDFYGIIVRFPCLINAFTSLRY